VGKGELLICGKSVGEYIFDLVPGGICTRRKLETWLLNLAQDGGGKGE